MTKLNRTIYPEVRVVDASQGIVDYVASDETIDSYWEVIRAEGWRFTNFRKNAPFVDSHDYSSVGQLLGKVIDFHVSKKQLVERVQWAIDVPENTLAQLGWKMTAAGYLKAVSVGFWPTRFVTKWDTDPKPFQQQLEQLGMKEGDGVRCVYLEQEQVELSACIIGANPNALAKAFKDGAVTEADVETFSQEWSQREIARAAIGRALAARAEERARSEFLLRFNDAIGRLKA